MISWDDSLPIDCAIPNPISSVMIVPPTESEFEFTFELFDFQSIAPQHLVLFVNVCNFVQESLKILDCSIDSVSSVIGILFVIYSPKGIFHIVDAHPGLDEEFLEFVQTNLNLLWAERIRRRG